MDEVNLEGTVDNISGLYVKQGAMAKCRKLTVMPIFPRISCIMFGHRKRK